jgi:hypothetical protein
MWLKVLTSLSMLLGIALLALYPWVVHRQPHAPGPGLPIVKRLDFEFHAMMLGYSGMVLFLFVATIALAMLLIRQAREEYRVALTQNVKNLVTSYQATPGATSQPPRKGDDL